MRQGELEVFFMTNKMDQACFIKDKTPKGKPQIFQKK